MKSDKRAVILGILSLILFIALTILIKIYPVNAFDTILTSVIQSPDNLYYPFVLLSFLGSVWFMIPLIAVMAMYLFLIKKYRYLTVWLISSILGASSFVLKQIIERIRPPSSYVDFSFPSGHTLISTVIYGWLCIFFWKKDKRLSLAFIALTILIGLSRVYLKVHWPTDVLGSLLLGIAIISLLFPLIKLRPN